MSHLGEGGEGVFRATSVRLSLPLYVHFGKSPYAAWNGAEWCCGPSVEVGMIV